ncbi:MAG: hypothetical protein ACFCUS_04010 [Rubrimonas sp.]|uniref:hypothetical protein n=1 Tax=Rubrimonas sp. TaxID=2036015 RepID=UPI002FDE2E42
MRRGVLAGALLAAALAAGCAETERAQVTNILVPAEVQRADLQRAHGMGLLTDAELAAQLAKIDG